MEAILKMISDIQPTGLRSKQWDTHMPEVKDYDRTPTYPTVRIPITVTSADWPKNFMSESEQQQIKRIEAATGSIKAGGVTLEDTMKKWDDAGKMPGPASSADNWREAVQELSRTMREFSEKVDEFSKRIPEIEKRLLKTITEVRDEIRALRDDVRKRNEQDADTSIQ